MIDVWHCSASPALLFDGVRVGATALKLEGIFWNQERPLITIDINGLCAAKNASDESARPG